MSERELGGVTVINVFFPKPERFEEFVRTQQGALPGFRGKVAGLRGGHFYRSRDGKSAVLVSVFESEQAQQAFMRSDLFHAHRDRLAPLLERVEPALYDLVYET